MLIWQKILGRGYGGAITDETRPLCLYGVFYKGQNGKQGVDFREGLGKHEEQKDFNEKLCHTDTNRNTKLLSLLFCWYNPMVWCKLPLHLFIHSVYYLSFFELDRIILDIIFCKC